MTHREFHYDPPLVPFLDTLYEDEDLIVVNKPSTILSVPGKLKIHRDSIMTRVKSIYPDAFVVHRLDYGTSGVLMLGLNKFAISQMGKQFIARQVHKVYVAWVAGKLEGTGAVDLPLILDLEHRPWQKVDFTVGKPALTYYQALAYDEQLDRTYVRLYPQTGRSHQLRVHMQQLGHPILGDHLYANDAIYECVPHLYLHAALLRCFHPRTNECLSFCAPAPFAVPPEHEPQPSWLDEDLGPLITSTLQTSTIPVIPPEAVKDDEADVSQSQSDANQSLPEVSQS